MAGIFSKDNCFFVHLKYHSPYQNSSQTLPLCWSIPVLRSFRLGGSFPRKESTKSQNRLAWLREITRTLKKNSFLTFTLIYILFTSYLAPHISVFVQRFMDWLPDITNKIQLKVKLLMSKMAFLPFLLMICLFQSTEMSFWVAASHPFFFRTFQSKDLKPPTVKRRHAVQWAPRTSKTTGRPNRTMMLSSHLGDRRQNVMQFWGKA